MFLKSCRYLGETDKRFFQVLELPVSSNQNQNCLEGQVKLDSAVFRCMWGDFLKNRLRLTFIAKIVLLVFSWAFLSILFTVLACSCCCCVSGGSCAFSWVWNRGLLLEFCRLLAQFSSLMHSSQEEVFGYYCRYWWALEAWSVFVSFPSVLKLCQSVFISFPSVLKLWVLNKTEIYLLSWSGFISQIILGGRGKCDAWNGIP